MIFTRKNKVDIPVFVEPGEEYVKLNDVRDIAFDFGKNAVLRVKTVKRYYYGWIPTTKKVFPDDNEECLVMLRDGSHRLGTYWKRPDYFVINEKCVSRSKTAKWMHIPSGDYVSVSETPVK